VSVGCLATNSRAARFSIGPSKCYIWETTESTSHSTPVGLRSQSTPDSLRNQCVSESSSVNLRNQKSTVLAVNYRRWKPVFGSFSSKWSEITQSVFSCELLC
jgi:hypothetical protein